MKRIRKIISKSIIILMMAFSFKSICKGQEVQALTNSLPKHFEVYDEQKFNQGYQQIEFVNSQYLLLIDDEISLYDGNIKLTINDNYHSFYLDQNILYIVGNKLSVVDLKVLAYKQYDLTFTVNDIITNDQYVYLVGHQNNNACIQMIEKSFKANEFNLVKEKVFSGNGTSIFTKVIINNNHLVITGIKDAHLDSIYFSKVGNKGEMKSFVLELNEALEIVNNYYFNQNHPLEEVTQIYQNNEKIKVVLRASDKYFLYVFGDNLYQELSLLISDRYNHLVVLETIDQSILYMGSSNEFENTQIIDYGNNELVFELEEKFDSATILNGSLCISYKNMIQKIYEYHINKLEAKIVNRISYNLEEQNHFDVSSYFEVLDFKINKITPFHQYMKSGEYQIEYISTSLSGEKIIINTLLIVQDYVNIINNGVYQTNTTLMFFGDAILNDEVINNGYRLEKEGNYHLIVKDIDNNVHEYDFIVDDDYYKENDHIVIPYDYKVIKGDTLDILIDLDSNEVVEDVIINQASYPLFEQFENKLSIKVLTNNSWGYHKLSIDQIVYENQVVEVNESKTILTLKNKPQVSLDLQVKDMQYQLSLLVEDIDNTLVDIIIENDQEVYNTLLKNQTIDVLNSDSKAIVYMEYELGDGKIIKEKVFEIRGKLPNNFSYKQKVVKDSLGIKQISISLNGNDFNNCNCQLIVDNQSIMLGGYKIPKTFLMIITAITIIVLAIFVIFLFIKVKSHKKINKLIVNNCKNVV